jgi:hypothetical protein
MHGIEDSNYRIAGVFGGCVSGMLLSHLKLNFQLRLRCACDAAIEE